MVKENAVMLWTSRVTWVKKTASFKLKTKMNFAVLGRLLWQASLIPKILDFNSLDIMYVVLIKDFDLIDRMYLKAHFGPFSPKTLDSNFLHIIYGRVHESCSPIWFKQIKVPLQWKNRQSNCNCKRTAFADETQWRFQFLDTLFRFRDI